MTDKFDKPWLEPDDNRPAGTLSATDEDHANPRLEEARSSGPKAPLETWTPKGWKPFYPPSPEPVQSPETTDDNPENPRGGPSLSLPQQATPLTSVQGVLPLEDLTLPGTDPRTLRQEDPPDDPRNPRGSPDYLVGDAAA